MSGTINNPDVQFNGSVTCLMRCCKIIIVVSLLLLAFSFSGCVEQDEGQPDELPDVYESSMSSESDIQEGELSNSIPVGILTVTSKAFDNGTMIPAKYTCDGDNINPDIKLGNIADDVVSLLLIMDDPDAPSGTFTHWVIWNIDPDMEISENDSSGVEGLNSAGQASYIGPCPPSDTHRYFFKFYALDTELDLEQGSELSTVEDAMDGHVVAYGELVGLYRRS